MMRSGPGGPALPNTVLLTHLPSFLQDSKRLREWVAVCGNPRSLTVITPTKQQQREQADDVETKDDGKDDNVPGPSSTAIASITFSHADATTRFVTAFKHLLGNYQVQMQCHVVPLHDPTIPLPPAILDAATVQILGQRLLQAYQQVEQGREINVASTTTHVSDNNDAPSDKENNNNEPIITASTMPRTNHHDDDPEEMGDPLETPDVKEAVQAFRARLAQDQGDKAGARQTQLDRLLQEAMARLTADGSTTLLAPPLPPPPPPPSLVAPGAPPPPPPSGGGAAAPRGVSNLPAWMTSKESGSGEAGDQPAAKKAKTDQDES